MTTIEFATTQIEPYLSSRSRTVYKWCSQRLQPRKMVRVYMAEEARKWWSDIGVLEEIIDPDLREFCFDD